MEKFDYVLIGLSLVILAWLSGFVMGHDVGTIQQKTIHIMQGLEQIADAIDRY